ncbi:MAG: hypothetical protein GY702_02500 [Desulfobulbaceae bacterium]|nr:hypothetical protein [Desulfobulbaceae bacterium]
MQSIEGKIISVDYSNQQFTLHVIKPTTTTITVSYDERTIMCGQREGSLKGCCVRVGNRAEIKGAFSTSDDTLFSAVSIRGAYNKRRHDPTGVRSRLHSCARGIVSGQ